MKQPLRRWYTGFVQEPHNPELFRIIFRELLSFDEALERIGQRWEPGTKGTLLERKAHDGLVIATYHISVVGAVLKLGKEEQR